MKKQQSSQTPGRACPRSTDFPTQNSAAADAGQHSTQSNTGSYTTEYQAYYDAVEQHRLQQQRLGTFLGEPWGNGNRTGALPYQMNSADGYYHVMYAGPAHYDGKPASYHAASQQPQQQQQTDLAMVGSWATAEGSVASPPVAMRDRRARSTNHRARGHGDAGTSQRGGRK